MVVAYKSIKLLRSAFAFSLLKYTEINYALQMYYAVSQKNYKKKGLYD